MAAGKTCLVIDKRDHIAGNVYTEKVEGIDFHKYGAHIFHGGHNCKCMIHGRALRAGLCRVFVGERLFSQRSTVPSARVMV